MSGSILSPIQVCLGDSQAAASHDGETDTQATSPIAGTSPTGSKSKTSQVAARFEAAAHDLPYDQRCKFLSWAKRLRLCAARDDNGNRPQGTARCGLAVCPACQAQVAKDHQDRLARALRLAREQGQRCQVIRLSVVAFAIVEGHKQLVSALGMLRRRKLWRKAVAGGAQYLDLLDPTQDGAAVRWNTHAHIVVVLFDGAWLDPDDLATLWTELLTKLGTTGSVHVQAVAS